jgi:general nucleoside transport system ATP-binding protein
MDSFIDKSKIEKYLIYFEKITKSYEDTLALSNISFGIKEGTIHGIVGENGAGKTTLINLLCGKVKPTSGNILIRGKKIHFKNPRQANNTGIGVVHQNLSLLNNLKIWENISLSEPKLPFLIKPKAYIENITRDSHKLQFKIDPTKNTGQLALGKKQQVEIFKVLRIGFNILVALDEPTAVLTPNESTSLLNLLKDLKRQGNTVIYITHKLSEIHGIADTLTILRNGKLVKHCSAKDITYTDILIHMFGEYRLKKTQNIVRPRSTQQSEILIELKSISQKESVSSNKLENISFRLNKGEIIGIAGIAGNGQKALAEILAGKTKKFDGILKAYYQNNNPSLTIPYVPEDIIEEAVALDLTVYENMFIYGVNDQKFKRGPIILWKKIVEETRAIMIKYGISPVNPYLKARSLSGGNLQKLVLARELSKKNASVLIAHNPTKGLDLQTTYNIHELMVDLATQSYGIVLISEDLDELLKLSHKIIIIRRGKMAYQGECGLLSKYELGKLMVGNELTFNL